MGKLKNGIIIIEDTLKVIEQVSNIQLPAYLILVHSEPSVLEAFGRGDVSTITEYLADNVEWEQWADNSAQTAGVPWMQAQ